MSRPNVLMFMLHDLGDHLGCYGHRTVKSPRIDGLARQGARFTNYFTAAPECTPSRAGMMTGLYTHQNGLMGLCHRGWEFHPETKHLAQYLSEGGYRTLLFGLQHETGGSPERLGYQEAHSQEDRSAVAVCREMVDFLEDQAQEGPWFAHVGFFDVHRAWSEDSSFEPEEVDVPAYLPDNPEVRRDLTHLHQNIFETDTAIGTVLDALSASGRAEDTVVISATDHGCPFPRAKSTFYDPGIRIPLIARWPGRFEESSTHDALLSNLDFTPTILDICECDIPEGLVGQSFRPLLKNKDCSEREDVFGALYYDAFYDPIHSVRTRTHKYIRSFAVTDEDAQGAYPEVLAEHKTGTWIRADDSDVQRSLAWLSMQGDYEKPPREELYDLAANPLEQRNVVDDPTYGAVLEDMRRRMQRMMVETDSPFLSGHVSPDLSRTRNQRG